MRLLPNNASAKKKLKSAVRPVGVLLFCHVHPRRPSLEDHLASPVLAAVGVKEKQPEPPALRRLPLPLQPMLMLMLHPNLHLPLHPHRPNPLQPSLRPLRRALTCPSTCALGSELVRLPLLLNTSLKLHQRLPVDPDGGRPVVLVARIAVLRARATPLLAVAHHAMVHRPLLAPQRFEMKVVRSPEREEPQEPRALQMAHLHLHQLPVALTGLGCSRRHSSKICESWSLDFRAFHYICVAQKVVMACMFLVLGNHVVV